MNGATRSDEPALAVQDLEITRHKPAEPRKTAGGKILNDRLELAIARLGHTKDHLMWLGRPAKATPTT